MAKKRKSARRRFQRARKPLRSKTRKSATGKRKRAWRYVYYFGDGNADGKGTMKPLLGGKGANLHEMTRIGLPVPPGFTITTEVCSYFYDHNRAYPPQLEVQVAAAMAKVEKSTGKKFADQERPLLVSVRSGARDSMPGKSRHERRRGRDRRQENEQRAFCLGFLSPISSDVRRRGDGCSETAGRRP